MNLIQDQGSIIINAYWLLSINPKYDKITFHWSNLSLNRIAFAGLVDGSLFLQSLLSSLSQISCFLSPWLLSIGSVNSPINMKRNI
jgi:hypothetical protein